MSKSELQTRERLVAAAADMISRRGLAATSIRELAKYANTPLGSTYHYFPGGKHQVTVEAVRYAGDEVSSALRALLQDDPVAGLRGFLNLWRSIVIESDFRAGCSVLSVATEEPVNEEGLEALGVAAKVFNEWEMLIAEALHTHGADRREANKLATLVIASVEGSVALCRARRSVSALDDIADQLEMLIRQALTN